MPSRSALFVACLLVVGACGTAARADVCGSLDAGAAPQPAPLRVIELNQRWTAVDHTFCVAGIRVYDGHFDIVGYEVTSWSWVEPWAAASVGMSHGRLFDERGRAYSQSGSSGFTGPIGQGRVYSFESPGTPSLKPQGDVLAGVHDLRFIVDRTLQGVSGPWRFERLPARSGPLTATAISAGHELHLYDLVVTATGFSVGFQQLGQVTPGTVILTEPLTASDDRGTRYGASGTERRGSSPLLYQIFVPAPPPEALLTIEIPAVYLSTDNTWEGKLTLP